MNQKRAMVSKMLKGLDFVGHCQEARWLDIQEYKWKTEIGAICKAGSINLSKGQTSWYRVCLHFVNYVAGNPQCDKAEKILTFIYMRCYSLYIQEQWRFICNSTYCCGGGENIWNGSLVSAKGIMHLLRSIHGMNYPYDKELYSYWKLYVKIFKDEDSLEYSSDTWSGT